MTDAATALRQARIDLAAALRWAERLTSSHAGLSKKSV